MTPADENQNQVMKAIYEVETGNHAVKRLVLPAIQELIGRGASGLILGCTDSLYSILSAFLHADRLNRPPAELTRHYNPRVHRMRENLRTNLPFTFRES